MKALAVLFIGVAIGFCLTIPPVWFFVPLATLNVLWAPL